MGVFTCSVQTLSVVKSSSSRDQGMLGEKRKGTRLVSSSGSADKVNQISEMARLAQRGDVRYFFFAVASG